MKLNKGSLIILRLVLPNNLSTDIHAIMMFHESLNVLPNLVNKAGTKKRKTAVSQPDVDANLHMRSTNRVSTRIKERHEQPPLKSEEDDDNEEEKKDDRNQEPFLKPSVSVRNALLVRTDLSPLLKSWSCGISSLLYTALIYQLPFFQLALYP